MNVMVPLTWTMPICSLCREGWLRTRSPALSLATNLRTWEKQRGRDGESETDEKMAGSCIQRARIHSRERTEPAHPVRREKRQSIQWAVRHSAAKSRKDIWFLRSCVACFPVQYTVKNTQCRNKVTLFALEYKQLWDHTAILHQQSSL